MFCEPGRRHVVLHLHGLRSFQLALHVLHLFASSKGRQGFSGAWAETQEELAKGWLFHDPNPDLSDVLLAERFGIDQGCKVRPSRFEHEHLSARGIERAPRVESWPWS